MDANKLAKAYIKIRDTISELTREYEAKKEALEAEMDLIEEYFLNTFNEQGELTSISTPSGIVKRSIKTLISTTDWAELHDLITKTNNLDLLERRISQKNMAAFIEEHPELRPAGLNIHRKYKITVQRKSPRS